MFKAARTVMTFAAAPEASARWWGELLDVPVKLDVSDTGAVYAWVEIGGAEVGFHPADDERNPRGGSLCGRSSPTGTVVWEGRGRRPWVPSESSFDSCLIFAAQKPF